MAEITPSGNAEQSSESCYSTEEIKGKSQVVYVYSSNNFQVKTEPVDKESYEEFSESSHSIADEHMKSCRDRYIQQQNTADWNRSGGYPLRPVDQRFPSKRDHLSEPKRNWTREAITRYEGNSYSFSSNRHVDTILQSRYEDSRHNLVRNISDDDRNSHVRGSQGVFIESRGDYVKKPSKDRKMILDAQYPVHEKKSNIYYSESQDEANRKISDHDSAPTQRGLPFRREREFHFMKAGRKSATPNRINPSERENYTKNSMSPRPYSAGMKRDGDGIQNAPPNVTLIKKDHAKYSLYEEQNRAQELEDDSQWERDEHGKTSPNNHPSSEQNSPGGGKKGSYNYEFRSEIAKHDGKDFRDTVSDEEKTKGDIPVKRMRKEAYFGRRELGDDFEFVSRDLHRNSISRSEDEWPYPNRPRIVEHQDPAEFRKRPNLSDRRCSSLPKGELSIYAEPRYRYAECYVVRGCMDQGCNNNYGEIPSSLRSVEDSKEHGDEQPRRFSSDEEKRIPEMSLMRQGYQRCCCPCCPCYSAFRSGSRDRSPVSPRCHPRPQPVSPRHYSHSEFPASEKPKAKAAAPIPAIPAEMQPKLVPRNIPHLRRRRNRTVYTHDQIEELEDVFKIKHYLDVDEKGSIAKRLGIRTENVEIWFKNRRAKWRKEMKAAKSTLGENEVSQFLDSPEQADSESKDEFGDRDSPVTFARNINEDRRNVNNYQDEAVTTDGKAREVSVDN